MALSGISALRRAIEIIGSQTATAAVVGRTPQAVSEIVRLGSKVPAEWCIPIEDATRAKGDIITRHQLRPDLYPPPEATGAKPKRGSKTPSPRFRADKRSAAEARS